MSAVFPAIYSRWKLLNIVFSSFLHFLKQPSVPIATSLREGAANDTQIEVQIPKSLGGFKVAMATSKNEGIGGMHCPKQKWRSGTSFIA